jgi:hypothetical protein
MSTASNRRLRRAYLVASYLVWLMVMTRVLIMRDDASTDYVSGSILAVLITMACAYDAALLRRPWAFGARFPFLSTWPVSTPLYIIRSRGSWGCVVLLIHAALLVAIVVAIAIVVGVAHLMGR